ncbi:MAG: hypothetical protein ACREVN_13095 [Gammaproteobacteria bacterium]
MMKLAPIGVCAVLVIACTGPSAPEPSDEAAPGAVTSEDEIEAARQAMPHPDFEARSRIEPGLDEQAASARADLAQRLGIDEQSIEVVQAIAVTWRNSGLGCPEPDMRYMDVLTPGVLIRLRSGDASYEYHGGRQSKPFLCEPPGRIEEPLPSARYDDGT